MSCRTWRRTRSRTRSRSVTSGWIGSPTAFTLLFLGRLIPRKDLGTLLEAAAFLAGEKLPFRLRLVGPADDDGYFREVEARIRELGLEDRVDLPGAESPAEIADELRRAVLLVLSSRQETAPVVVLEAMAAGLPVVATDAGGTRHLIEDGASGAVVPREDPQALARAIAGYLRDPDLGARHGARGRAIAEDRFRAGPIVDRTLEVYRRALQEVHGSEKSLDREVVIG